jgi:NAD(P)-dependent dehydrogenase (short-subunit alcohol dehydrogenase family)
VDLLGAIFFTKQAFLTMKQGGAIVDVFSVHAIETPLVASYAADKAALLSLTRSMALEGKPNCQVSPGNAEECMGRHTSRYLVRSM